MAKFVMKCPVCGTVNRASTSLFAKKEIICGNCKEKINIKEARMTSRVCPYCKDTFIYDQAKGKTAKCPSCGKTVDAFHKGIYITVNCPQCACSVDVDENTEKHQCPICDHIIDVAKEKAKMTLVNSSGVSVIQYEGDNSTFVWKHPIEDFNMGSQLIVHESQEAIFFMNGQALDTFGPGRHTLATENLPILKNIYRVPSGAQTPFHAEVYFINKSTMMGMKWGTDSRVRFIDPATGIPLDIGASGEMNLRVVDGRKLLIKLVGTTGGLSNKEVLSVTAHSAPGSVRVEISPAQKALQTFFRAPLMTEIKSYLASTIKSQNLNIMEMDEQMGVLSDALRERIAPKFEEYGLTIPNFYITYISLPEDDPNYKRLVDLRASSYLGVRTAEVKADIAQADQRGELIKAQTEAMKETLKAQTAAEALKAKGLAEASVMHAKGYTERDVIQAGVQKSYAEGLGKLGSNAGGSGGNGGNGGMISDVVGVVAGMKMAGMAFDKIDFGATAFEQPTAQPESKPAADTWTCKCGETGNTKKFCMNCGSPKPEAWKCSCGHEGNVGKFCEECGNPKPTSWDCACGQKGNTGKCCPECGAKRPS